MDLYQLRYFVAVAEERTFTRGAQREQVAQSAVSKAVSRLERELGLVLFTRVGRGTELTQAGERLLPQARAMLQSAVDAKRDFDDLRTKPAGTVTVAIGLSVGSLGLADVLSGVRHRYPDICLQLLSAPHQHEDHAVSVLKGAFDLAVIAAPTFVPSGIEVVKLGTAGPVLATATTHDLAGQRLALADVCHLPFVDFPPTWAYRSFTNSLFAVHDHQRHVCFEVESVWAAVDLIAAEAAIGFLPRDVVDRSPGALTPPTLQRPPAPIALVLLSPERTISKAITAVRDAIASLTG